MQFSKSISESLLYYMIYWGAKGSAIMFLVRIPNLVMYAWKGSRDKFLQISQMMSH